MSFFFSHVPLESIDTSDLEFNLHPHDVKNIDSKLQESFAETGILHPPLVQKINQQGAKCYRILCGQKRIAYLSNINQDSDIDVNIVSGAISDLQILRLILEDQKLSGKEMTLTETAHFLRLATQKLGTERTLKNFRRKLNIKVNKGTISELEQLLRQPLPIIEMAHNGILSFPVFKELLLIKTEGDRVRITEIFNFLNLGNSKQRRLLQLLRDIAYANNLSIESLLEDDEIVRILKHDQLNIPQKQQHFLNLLQQYLQPELAETETVFFDKVSSLNLLPTQSIQHSQAFEKDEVTLSIVFRNFEECEQYLKKINAPG